jgi:hypothetical protein
VNGPNDELRELIFSQLAALPEIIGDPRVASQAVEDGLDEILNRIVVLATIDLGSSDLLPRIEDRLEAGRIDDDDLGEHETESKQLLASVDQWISVASYASAWVYAPQSPRAGNRAGWPKKIAETLRRLAHILLPPLRVAARGLGAVQWSVGVAFPWGVSISVTW